MANFNVILLSSQQREAKQACTLYYLYAFFGITEYGYIEEGKKGENQNEKSSSHQCVHFHIIVFNENLF